MSIFGNILGKIFGHGDTPGKQATTPPPAAQRPTPATPAASVPKPVAPTPAPAQPVDVEAVLTQIAAAKGCPSNWQTSIVDLLTLLDLDSSLTARKELGIELNVHAGTDGSAEQNIALHKAVMRKLAENGGKVPPSLRD